MTISIDKQVPNGLCDADERGDNTLFASGTVMCGMISAWYIKERYSSGFVFEDINIPNARHITAAHISFYIHYDINDDACVRIYGNDVDNANDFDTEKDVIDRVKTTAYVDWIADGIGTGWKDSPDISSVIQELVDRPGWAANNDMCIIGFGFGVIRTKSLVCRSYDYDPTLAAKLHIEYEGVAAQPRSFGYIIG